MTHSQSRIPTLPRSQHPTLRAAPQQVTPASNRPSMQSLPPTPRISSFGSTLRYCFRFSYSSNTHHSPEDSQGTPIINPLLSRGQVLTPQQVQLGNVTMEGRFCVYLLFVNVYYLPPQLFRQGMAIFQGMQGAEVSGGFFVNTPGPVYLHGI